MKINRVGKYVTTSGKIVIAGPMVRILKVVTFLGTLRMVMYAQGRAMGMIFLLSWMSDG